MTPGPERRWVEVCESHTAVSPLVATCAGTQKGMRNLCWHAHTEFLATFGVRANIPVFQESQNATQSAAAPLRGRLKAVEMSITVAEDAKVVCFHPSIAKSSTSSHL
eukprot:2278815-Pleurochrysis_carterae.AAC.5